MKSIIKLFSLLLLVLLFPVNISANDTTNLTYTVDQSYSWEIHTAIDFGSNAGTNQTINRTATLNDHSTAGVRVNSNVIPNNAVLNISITDDNNFTLSNNDGVSLNYTVAKTLNGDPLSGGSTVLSVSSGTNSASQELYFSLATGSSDAEFSGTYTGTISYTSSIFSPPVRYNFITLDNDNSVVYRILNVEGSEALLMRMTRYSSMINYDSTPETAEFENGEYYVSYANSDLDTFCNTTYYNQLSNNIKSAIVDKTIYQSVYQDVDNQYIDDLMNTSRITKREVGLRHVYAIDLDDIKTYLIRTDNSLKSDLLKFFTNANGEHINSMYGIHTRSACGDCISSVNNPVFFYHPYHSEPMANRANSDSIVSICFTVDLSKLDYVEHSTSEYSKSQLGW